VSGSAINYLQGQYSTINYLQGQYSTINSYNNSFILWQNCQNDKNNNMMIMRPYYTACTIREYCML